jgi:hypothetical protein
MSGIGSVIVRYKMLAIMRDVERLHATSLQYTHRFVITLLKKFKQKGQGICKKLLTYICENSTKCGDITPVILFFCLQYIPGLYWFEV